MNCIIQGVEREEMSPIKYGHTTFVEHPAILIVPIKTLDKPWIQSMMKMSADVGDEIICWQLWDVRDRFEILMVNFITNEHLKSH